MVQRIFRRIPLVCFTDAFGAKSLQKVTLLTVLGLTLTAMAFGQAREGYGDEEMVGVNRSVVRPILETETRRADGYEGWGFLGNAGAEVRWRRTTSMLLGSVNTEDKVDVHSGTNLGIDLNSYFNVSRHFYSGGGVIGGKLWTSRYSKQSYHPYVGVGMGFSGWTATADYLLEGTDHSNGVRGWRIGWTIPMADHKMYWVQTWSLYNSYPTGCPSCERGSAVAMSMGVRYRF